MPCSRPIMDASVASPSAEHGEARATSMAKQARW
jgi:hypothetical protein